MATKEAAQAARFVLKDGALGAYLAKTGDIPCLKLPLKTSKIGYGQSNPTYFVDDAGYVGPSPFRYCLFVDKKF